MMRVLDAFLSIPRVLILIAVLTIWHPVSLAGLVVLIGVTGWFDCLATRARRDARPAPSASSSHRRARARRVATADRAGGICCPTSPHRSSCRATLAVGNVIALEAGLSYLGIGVQPPTPSWGSIFHDGADEVHRRVVDRLLPRRRDRRRPCWRSTRSATPCATSSIHGRS